MLANSHHRVKYTQMHIFSTPFILFLAAGKKNLLKTQDSLWIVAVEMSHSISITHKNVLELTRLDLLEKESPRTLIIASSKNVCHNSSFNV